MTAIYPCSVRVLRLGHRIPRDKRITTHVCLVARAFGAEGVYIAGDLDPSIEQTIRKVVETWGGNFWVKYTDNPEELVDNYRKEGWTVIHLTMYGIPLQNQLITEITQKSKKGILAIIGAEKVPPWTYQKAHYNIAIGNQPHSEVAALAILLDRLSQGKWVNLEFPNAKLKVIPSPRGKQVVKSNTINN